MSPDDLAPDLPDIRVARDSDGPAIATLIADCFSDYPGCLFDWAEFPELRAPATHFAHRRGRLWVAVTSDGTLAGSIAATPAADGRSIELTKMYVAKAWRGSGLARRLYGGLRRHAEAAGAPGIMLWTDTRFVRAHAFYAGLGFVRQAETRFLGDISDTHEYLYRLGLVPAGAGS